MRQPRGRLGARTTNPAMRPSRFLPRIAPVCLLLWCVPGRAAACDTEQDRIVWARERMHPRTTQDQLQLVYQWLLNGTRSCAESGDLWYYRGVVANRIHDTADAAYSFRKAQ